MIEAGASRIGASASIKIVGGSGGISQGQPGGRGQPDGRGQRGGRSTLAQDKQAEVKEQPYGS
jgi:hypothetical protein